MRSPPFERRFKEDTQCRVQEKASSGSTSQKAKYGKVDMDNLLAVRRLLERVYIHVVNLS